MRTVYKVPKVRRRLGKLVENQQETQSPMADALCRIPLCPGLQSFERAALFGNNVLIVSVHVLHSRFEGLFVNEVRHFVSRRAA